MEAIKEGINKVTEAISGNSNTSATNNNKTVEGTMASHVGGGFPQPSEFPSQTQHEKVVGLEQIMTPLPEFLVHEDGTSYKPANKLFQKKALVTGGDSGIGRAVAVAYALEGADVAIGYLPEEQEDALVTKKYVEQAGRKCLLMPYDIRFEDNCRRMIEETVAGLGGLDILVNNASVMYDVDSITDITTEQFDRTVKTNVYGTFWVTKYAVPHLKKGASIIQTTSLVAYQGPPSLLDYTMTKAAMVGLTRSLSNQLCPKGIRVNSVAPGPVWTPLQPCAMTQDKLDKWHKDACPLIGRIGQPIELVGPFVLLASTEGSFISGQAIHVNGGTIVNG